MDLKSTHKACMHLLRVYLGKLFCCFNVNFWVQAVVERTGVNPAEVGDIVIGSVLAPGAQRANECRMAAFFAGFPGRVPSLVTSSVLL